MAPLLPEAAINETETGDGKCGGIFHLTLGTERGRRVAGQKKDRGNVGWY
jgi:hypothetical protein